MRIGERVLTETFGFAGGLDQVTPALGIAPGKAIDALNYEPDISGGYRRMYGFERFDGRPRPSDANYYILYLTPTATGTVGDIVTGLSSGVTGKVIKVVSAGELVVTRVTGEYQAGETLSVAGSAIGTLSNAQLNGALTAPVHAQYRLLAANDYRADIQKVPGSGPVRGAWMYKGDIYAFRDNSGATACEMHKATTSGWSKINFGRELQFTSSVLEIKAGDLLVGKNSGASAIVKVALLRTGTWSVNGAGTLIFDSVLGTFQNGEDINVGATKNAVAASTDTAITLLPGGRFSFTNANFSGQADTLKMYFVDGVNFLHEFDGTRLVPIRTGVGGDVPTSLAYHRSRIFVAIKASLQMSGVGNPYSWTALTGAAELGTGDDITGTIPQSGSSVASGTTAAMAVFTKSQPWMLYGTDSNNFQLVPLSMDTGAVKFSMQNIAGQTYYLGANGVSQLSATANFGNFQMATISRHIQPLIDQKKGKLTATSISRSTNQYRVYFNDGTGLTFYIVPDGDASIMPFRYSEEMYFHAVESVIDPSNNERKFASGSDGYVYELDVGTSFDGNAIFSYLFLAFNHFKSPRTRKRFRRMIMQMSVLNTADVTVGYEIDYGTDLVMSGAQLTSTFLGAGGYWDQMTWDKFNWDSPLVSDARVDTPGNGMNLGFVVYGNTADNEPYTLHSAIVHYSISRIER